MRINGNELSDEDQHELNQITCKSNDVQKTLENYRKEWKSHTIRVKDYKDKKNMGIF